MFIKFLYNISKENNCQYLYTKCNKNDKLLKYLRKKHAFFIREFEKKQSNINVFKAFMLQKCLSSGDT